MKILDLFCGIGGMARGFKQADPNVDILGIDIDTDTLEKYPFPHLCVDAIKYLDDHMDEIRKNFDLIHASPPCHFYSFSTTRSKLEGAIYPKLIQETRKRLKKIKKPYIIENVVGASKHLIQPIMLDGTMFNLPIIRPRLFEIYGFYVRQLPKGAHPEKYYRLLSGGGAWISEEEAERGIEKMPLDVAEKLFGVTGTEKQVAQIIPPAYSKFLLEQFMNNKSYNLTQYL